MHEVESQRPRAALLCRTTAAAAACRRCRSTHVHPSSHVLQRPTQRTAAAMASTDGLLHALADRPEELALLLRCEYRPQQTLLHHAAAEGDIMLIQALLAYDPSLARVELNVSTKHNRNAWENALMSAVAALQPAAVRALLPHCWPPPQPPPGQQAAINSSSSKPASSGIGSPCSTEPGCRDQLAPSFLQVGLLARLLHSIAAYEGWVEWHCGTERLGPWPDPPQPPPADLRQQAEATLLALLEGPHGGLAQPGLDGVALPVGSCHKLPSYLVLRFIERQ